MWISATFVIQFTSSPTWPQPTQFTQPQPSFPIGFLRCPALSTLLQRRGVQGVVWSCGKNPAALGRGGLGGLCSFPSKGTHGSQANSSLCESAPTLPNCPLHQSFEPINTGTPTTPTSYLQENKPVREVVQDTEQTSTRTKDSTLPGKPFNPGCGALTIEMEKNWQWLYLGLSLVSLFLEDILELEDLFLKITF